MTETRWRLFRHKDNPGIKYYASGQVLEPSFGQFASAANILIRCPRNAFHPQFDYPSVEQMPPGGLWPAKSFLELYEQVTS